MPRGYYDRRPRLVSIDKRFFAKVVRQDDGCWHWSGAKSSFGHGQLYKGGPASGGRKLLMAHRVSWEIHNGPIPEGMCVLHKCDVPWCVNPEHLFLGSKQDNTNDMRAKGRMKMGADLPQCKLTIAQVEAIRNCHSLSYREIAAIAGVSSSQVTLIKNGKSRVLQ